MGRRHELGTRLNPDTGEREWGLALWDYSRSRELVFQAVLRLCSLTGHRIEYAVTGPVSNWAFARETRVLLVPISEDDAFLVDPKWVTSVKRDDRAEEEDED